MSGRYRTIVADPPWPMPDSGKTTRGETDAKGVYTAKSGRVVDGTWWGRHRGGSVRIPYERMPLEEIAALPVHELAADHAHLYLWTTNRFLWDAKAVAEAWGFTYSTLLTWCKTPMGIGFGGAYTLTSEFVLFCRRGSLAPTQRHDTTWMNWPRPYENGHIAHSAKPDAFLDLVEQISPGPYVELFARRARFGWDYWGDQSLGTASMPEEAA
jgi:N6-adenosine-specific RNA methylase IME4